MPIVAGITRSVARAVIGKLFASGRTATAALGYFRGIGGKIRTKTWFADWREITGAKKLERTFKFIPRKYRLSYTMMAPTETFQDAEFKYMFETSWRNLETGQEFTKAQSLGSDTRYSPEEAEQEMMDTLDREMGLCAFDGIAQPVSTKLYTVYRRKLPPGAKIVSPEETARWYGLS